MKKVFFPIIILFFFLKTEKLKVQKCQIHDYKLRALEDFPSEFAAKRSIKRERFPKHFEFLNFVIGFKVCALEEGIGEWS